MRARLECRCLAALEAMCTFRLQISRKPKTWLTLDNSAGMSEYLSQIHVFLSFVQGHSDSETLWKLGEPSLPTGPLGTSTQASGAPEL